ncbi:MAG: hypothetical protein ACXW6T_07120 [Candidatus Binatia bacterium]
MKVVGYKSASDFLDRSGAWLETAEAENNLILGIATCVKSNVGKLRVEPYFMRLNVLNPTKTEREVFLHDIAS